MSVGIDAARSWRDVVARLFESSTFVATGRRPVEGETTRKGYRRRLNSEQVVPVESCAIHHRSTGEGPNLVSGHDSGRKGRCENVLVHRPFEGAAGL